MNKGNEGNMEKTTTRICMLIKTIICIQVCLKLLLLEILISTYMRARAKEKAKEKINDKRMGLSEVSVELSFCGSFLRQVSNCYKKNRPPRSLLEFYKRNNSNVWQNRTSLLFLLLGIESSMKHIWWTLSSLWWPIINITRIPGTFYPPHLP